MKINKIFGIGLPKTGTTSFDMAMKILGYKTKEWPNLVEEILLYDVVSDGRVALWYKDLDILFPNSKFILTVRNIDEWLLSCEFHYNIRNNLDNITNEKIKIRYAHSRLRMFGTLVYDKEIWKKRYYQHLDDVKKYFKNSPSDLLEIDICSGEGWDKLCPFLSKEIPSELFPHGFPTIDEKYNIMKNSLR